MSPGMPVYPDIHPMSDYEPVGNAGTAWIGSHRQCSSRQLAVIKEVHQTTASDIQRFVQLAHLHIARPIALYSTSAKVYVAQEYIELDLDDLLPLSEIEIAVIMSQILDAVHHLIQKQVGFRISAIRISAKGDVKIVPDWNFETNLSSSVRSANIAYVALYLGETMLKLCPNPSPQCFSFIYELSSGSIPAKNHSFLIQAKNSIILTCKYAVQRKLASIT
ncbi:hypothetical protein V8C42DRAFT_336867 [Trichoderma barbatum]